MSEVPNQNERTEGKEGRSTEDIQHERNSLLLESEEIRSTLDGLTEHGKKVKDAIDAVGSSGNVSTDNMAKLKVLQVEQGLTDDEISKTNALLKTLDGKMQKLETLIDASKKKELDVYTAEAPVYQTSVKSWNELVQDATLAVKIQADAIALAAKHPENKQLQVMVAQMADAMRLYGANLPANPVEQKLQRNPQNERKIGIMLQMLDTFTPIALEYRKLSGEIKKTPAAPTPSPRPTPKVLPSKPEEKSPAAKTSEPKANSAAPETPAPKVKTPTPKVKKKPAPETIDLLEHEISLPADRTVFIRLKGAKKFAYLQPSFGRSRFELGDYAEALKSEDGTHWIVTPRDGRENDFETSLDGKTWTSPTSEQKAPQKPVQAPVTEKQAPVQQTQPVEKEVPSVTEPRQPVVTQEPAREAETTGEIRVTGPMTLEFPGTGTTMISYVTQNARSVKPNEFSEKSSFVNYYLYSAVRENGLWKFTLKPGYSADFTISTPNGTTRTVHLGADAVPAKTSEPQTPAPAPKAVPTPAPKFDPSAITKDASVPADALETPKAEPAATLKSTPKSVNTPDVALPPKEAVQKEVSAPVSAAEVRKSPETIQSLYDRFQVIFKEYNETMKADYEKYGSSIEWKMFDQRFSQLFFDLSAPFGGNMPQFTTAKDWRSLLSRSRVADRATLTRVLTKMQELLAEYRATEFKGHAPDKPQQIDTTAVDVDILKKEIETSREAIKAKGGKLAKDFAKLDVLYTEAENLAAKPDLKKAVLACHRLLAKNYAESTTQPGIDFFQSALTLVGNAKMLRAGMTESQLRRQLIEQADRTPFTMSLTAKQVLQLVKMKHRCDALRARTDLNESQKYDAIMGAMSDDSVLLDIVHQASAQLKALEALGYKTEVAMKNIFNTETVDWLLAAHLSPNAVKGLSDASFFYITRTDGKRLPEGNPASVSPEAQARTKGVTVEKKEEEDPNSRYLTDEEVKAFGFVLKPGEKAKVTDGTSYQACSEKACRKLKVFKSEEEVAAYLAERKNSPSAEAVKEKTPLKVADAEKPVAGVQAVPLTEAMSVQKEKGSNRSEVYTNEKARELRLPMMEGFTITLDPPVNGTKSYRFDAAHNSRFDGVALDVTRYSDFWVVGVRPEYQGKVTLIRDIDKSVTALTLKKTREVLPVRGAEEITSREQFAVKVLASELPVIVEFGASWCGPCKAMAPHMDEVARKYAGRVRIYKIDGEIFSDIYAQHLAPGAGAFPTIMVFDKGRKIHQTIGSLNTAGIEQLIPQTQRQLAQQN